MTDIQRIESDPRRSRAVIYNGVVYIGGQTADDRPLDVKSQTRQVLAKVERFLANAGTDKSRLISAQLWLANIERDIADVNEVWDRWTAKDSSPTRAAAEVKFASQDLLIEITAIAAI